MNKIDGQIWIESNAPYKLKYHRADKDFVVETSEEYTIPSNVDIEVGDLVKIDDDGHLAKAKFPGDLRNVIGMLVSKTGSVSKTGYVNIPLSKIEKSVAIGDNLYWLGAEPCSYSHSIVKNTENIKYHNLPLIGTVINKITEEGIDTDVTVHLNISSFDTTIEWSKALESFKVSDGKETINHNLPVDSAFVRASVSIDSIPALASYKNENGITTFFINPGDDTSHNYIFSGSVIYG